MLGRHTIKFPQGAYIRRGDVTEGFLRYEFVGLIFGGAYTWRGLFSEFYGICLASSCNFGIHNLRVLTFMLRLLIQ